MKVLIIGTFHHKNKEGLELMLSYLKIEYKWGTHIDIPNYDLIFSPENPVDTSKFPTKKFIFGNHFSVFPTNKLLQINNIYNNSIYIQPSEWASRVWKDMHAENILPVKTLPFAVNVDKFKPTPSIRRKVFIYFKARLPEELNYLTDFLQKESIGFEVFDYRKKYDEKDYIKCLQESKYGIWLGRHESQGFALEEALSMNVPLLVWDVTSMNQEIGYNRYPDISGTVIPYFDERCGEYFYKQNEFECKYRKFINNLDNYKPREYVLENLGKEKCSEIFMKLLYWGAPPPSESPGV